MGGFFMNNWTLFCRKLDFNQTDVDTLRQFAFENFETFRIYPKSINFANGSYFFLIKDISEKKLIVFGKGKYFNDFDGNETDVNGVCTKICSLNNYNCDIIRKIFPFTNPINHKGKKITLGLGDRLGLASPGHIRLIRDKDIFPFLAQQSMRELKLTGRTYHDVLSSAAWSVFQEGYTDGFGADGDHLKTAEEIKMALDCGFTMITLDCSDYINNRAATMSSDEIEAEYSLIPKADRQHLETKYSGKAFTLENGTEIYFPAVEFKRMVLTYFKAIKYTIDIYNNVIKSSGKSIDFEMSIDETLTPTTPESHYFVASELIDNGVEITSLAPRFCGEFQKGIDYRGDICQFRKEFAIHVKVAEHFGYKISVHSGSDKFSVFPIIGKETGGRYHLKTAGTNWLEAVRVIAEKNPDLYRRMHRFAEKNLHEAKKYYHISADLNKIPDIDSLENEKLPSLMDIEDSRQVLHITYGLILLSQNTDGSAAFRDEIYSTLYTYEDDYYKALEKHIGRHLTELGI